MRKCAVFFVVAIISLSQADVRFMRGDVNGDRVLDISDAVSNLLYLFGGDNAPELGCQDAADANDDGEINLADAVRILNYLFAGADPLPAPFWTLACDPTEGELSCGHYGEDLPCPEGGAIIVDHTCTDLSKVPAEWIEEAKAKLRIFYGHTSHGSQIVTGMTLLREEDDLYSFNQGSGSLSLYETGGDLGYPDSTTWAARTREQLDRPDNNRNVVVWSWCGEVSTRTEEMLQRDYLDLMDQLEQEYPDVKFIYMTGHLDGTGIEGNLHQRNEQIRAFCRANGKILFDFADIESYDPDGNFFLDKGGDDNCDYWINGEKHNWAQEWCERHPGECPSCHCAHSQCLNCLLKGRAFWWLLARISGWPGPEGK